jgi:adenylate cyclase
MRANTVFERLRYLYRHPRTAGLFGLALVIMYFLGVRAIGGFEELELAAYDEMVVWRASGSGFDTRVAQIVITEADVKQLGWPLSDGVLADIVDRLRGAGARAIGVDIFRPSPIGPGSDRLDRAIAATPQLVWADRFQENQWTGMPAPQAAIAANRVAFSDLVLDDRAVSRRGLLYLRDSDHWEMSLSLGMALRYLAAEGIRPTADADDSLILGHVVLPPLDADVAVYADVDTRGYQIMREFRAPAAIRMYPLQDLLAGAIPDDAIKGRAMIVGVASDTVKDFVTTSLDTHSEVGMAGSTLQGLFAAQLISHALDGLRPTRPLTQQQETAALLAALFAGGALGLFARRAWGFALAVTLGAVALPGLSYVAFLYSLWLPVASLTLAWAVSALVTIVAISLAERTQRAVLMRLFSMYVSAPVAKDVWQRRHEFVSGERPVPVRLSATVLATDINDFTTVSEALEPAALARWINLYMEDMTGLVDRFGGIVEHFAGDAITAVWGVPIARRSRAELAADASAAVQCALEMARSMEPLNRRYQQEGLPRMRVGVGVFSGDLIGCSIGSSDRQRYSTVGDTPNTAARLVTVAKDRMKGGPSDDDCQIVIGETTLALARDGFEATALGSIPLSGKSQPVSCFLVEGQSVSVPA